MVGRTKILDREVAAFLATNPGGRVVNLAAGLCTRFWRLDDGAVLGCSCSGAFDIAAE